jgi:hypothetical protein
MAAAVKVMWSNGGVGTNLRPLLSTDVSLKLLRIYLTGFRYVLFAQFRNCNLEVICNNCLQLLLFLVWDLTGTFTQSSASRSDLKVWFVKETQ